MNEQEPLNSNGYQQDSAGCLRLSTGLVDTQKIMHSAAQRRPEVAKHESQHIETHNHKMTPLIDTVKTIENSLVGHDDHPDDPADSFNHINTSFDQTNP